MLGLSDCTSKRKRGENNGNRLYGFQTFGDPGCPADFDGPFRDNIRIFLKDFARLENFLVDGMAVWSIALEVDDGCRCISLFIMEERVQNALRPHCVYCRCIGWSHHLVSKCRYHFIIPSQKSYNNISVQPMGVLDMQSHLLHGMIHSNGFGHLVSLSGREEGSKNASGREIMDLWDRTCAMLRVRKISVDDVAKKRGMELRLLHCVAYGDTWFGRWGFEFGRGIYGITQQTYLKAIEAIRGMPLSIMLQHFQCPLHPDVASIVAAYKKLSGNSVQTVGKLMSFMMELKSRLHTKPTTTTALLQIMTPCRWSVQRVQLATRVIIEALRISGVNSWVPRQHVRDVARARIGDTGLLDFVLKSLGNRVFGGHVVRRALNPVTKILEYSLQEVPSPAAPADCLERDAVWRDIVYLYNHLIENFRSQKKNHAVTAIPTAATIILQSRHLVKDYKGDLTRKGSANQWGFEDDEMLRIMCTVRLNDEPRRAESTPPDLVVVPPYSTIGDLKEAAQRALRDTYWITHDFHVERIAELEGKDDELLFGVIESGSCVAVEGTGIDMSSELRYQGGVDTWTVDCPSGTKI